ncbi:MAG: GPW/gp25 family protein [Pseudomonadota bacterium]|nr:GPW/gp25 family protein [Pseudomonadota bacterium]
MDGSGRHLAFPFRIGHDGRTATPSSLEEHVRDEIIQLLLTNPGERPFLPDFGGGLRRLVFEGNDDVTAGLAKASISQAISYWLKERIEMLALNVSADDSTLNVDLSYRLLSTNEEKQLRFQHAF